MSHKPLRFSALLKAGRNWGNGWVQKGRQLSCGDGIESRGTEWIRVGYQQWGLWGFETRGTWGQQRRVTAQPWPLTDSVSRNGPIRGSGWKGSGSGFLHADSPLGKFSECHTWGVQIATPWGLDRESFRKGSAHGNRRPQKGASRSHTFLARTLCACLYLSFLAFVVSDFHSSFLW